MGVCPSADGHRRNSGCQGSRNEAPFKLSPFFAEANWSLDRLGLGVFGLIESWLEETIFLGLDDTLARKRGLKIFGVGMHRDPLISTRETALTSWGHSWVLLGVIVKFPFRKDRWFCLPILFRLYLNKQSAQRERRVYRTRPELAVEMLQRLAKHCPTRRFHVIADSLYGGKSVLHHLPTNCDLTSRLHLDARLYGLPPERKPGTNGQPRKRGERLPSPRQMLDERSSRLQLAIYGRRDRVLLADCLAVWHATPDRRLRVVRVVAVEPLSGGRKVQAFYSTENEATAEEVLDWYAWRWSIEQSFQESKSHWGFEQPQGWLRQAVERTAPVAMLLYSLITLWFAEHGHAEWQAPDRPWYRSKRGPAFLYMLDELRSKTLRHEFSTLGLSGPGSRKVIQTLNQVASLAA